MRRAAIAAAWIAGTTIPLLASAVFLFGCCVLPFHSYIHKAMPMCERAVDALRGEHAGHHGNIPAPEKQEPVKRLVTQIPRAFHLAVAPAVERRAAAAGAIAYRTFISLGAVRCDRDVGLHLLISLLLI